MIVDWAKCSVSVSPVQLILNRLDRELVTRDKRAKDQGSWPGPIGQLTFRMSRLVEQREPGVGPTSPVVQPIDMLANWTGLPT